MHHALNEQILSRNQQETLQCLCRCISISVDEAESLSAASDTSLLQKQRSCCTICIHQLPKCPIYQGIALHHIPNGCKLLPISSCHSPFWQTSHRLDIRLTAEILDYCFASAVTDRGHVERTPLLFNVDESQLSEGQVCCELIQGVFLQNCFAVVIVSNSPVRCL